MPPFLGVLLAAVLSAASSTAHEADAAFQKHAWAKAAEAYKKLTEETPQDGIAWLRLGLSLVQLKQGADAIAPLEKAEKLGVNASFVQYEMAKAVALAGDKARALQILEALSEEDYAPVGPPVGQEKAFAALVDEPRFQKAAADLELNRAPCKGGETASLYRQLDFWLGDWKVVDKAGDLVGTSHVERILTGCALQETFHGQGGGEGRTLSSWNPGLRRWEQYAIDGQGVPTFFTGGFVGGELQLRADAATRRGVPLKWRLTTSKLPGGRVRQLGETSTDTGRTWTVQYDFTYERVPTH
jgi:hypothetical protein